MICPSCSATLPANSRFCPACGRAIDPGATPTMTSPPHQPRNAGAGSGTQSSGAWTSSADGFDHGRFAPGTRLGDRYRIVGRLGVGGMGEVYRADDLKLGQPVALKFLPESVERDAASLERLLVEIRTARQVSHPNVCRVYDVGDVDGRRFLTMEYVDGEDLKGLLRRIGRLPEDKGLEIARQICAGLAAIHDRGVLHRDLKPANVMLDGRGRVRLTDFGLALPAAAATSVGEIAGTPAYMAPEQLAGEPLSVATDVYALGLVLFELFTGERARKSDRLEDLRQAGRTPAATLTTSGSGAKLDPMIRRVIERCLDPDPNRRPRSAILIAAALPGGDPLAAALAAGETPSPQMVAAAGAEGGLSFKVAVPLLAALVAGVLFAAWLQGRSSYAAKVPFRFSPEVLAAKAEEMLGRLGYSEAVASSAAGFSYFGGGYPAWLDEHDKTATRWDHLPSVRPSIVRFWRRTSPTWMLPQNYFSGAPGGGLAVGRSDPPMDRPGMTYLELDREGRLVWFDAVLADKRPADATPPDWPALFREAGLDYQAFKAVEPEWTSRAESDASGAWTGPGADDAGAELRVEAAAFHGRPVFFRLIGPWTRPAGVTSASASRSVAQRISQFLAMGIVVSVFLAAIGLSLRNLRLGRTDTRGATRLAAAIGLLTAAAAALGSSNPGEAGSWIETAFMLSSWACVSALLAAGFYLAVEPFVRRHWPRMLISWSRLLDGRWRDPLVGRDLLVGATLGVALGFADRLRALMLVRRGAPPTMGSTSMFGWMGPGDASAELLATLPQAMWMALGIVVLLMLLRMLLRRELAAALLFVTIFTVAPSLGAGDTLVAVAFNLVESLAIVAIVTRFGLVTFVSYLFINQIVWRDIGFATPAFATPAFVLALVAKLGPGVFGFYTATRGRKGSAWLDG